jgi:hypothetical protein
MLYQVKKPYHFIMAPPVVVRLISGAPGIIRPGMGAGHLAARPEK